MAVNEVTIEGYLTKDPTLYKLKSGRTLCCFYLACPRDGYDNGTDYIRCKAWDKIADAFATYKHKGDHLILSGSLRYEKFENWKREDVQEMFVSCRKIEFLPKEIKAKRADDFFEKYPEILKLYNKFIKELKKNESDCISEN